MAEIPGMTDRLRLFVLPEYRLQGMEPKNEQIEKYSGSKFEPVFTVLSRQAAPRDKAGNTELAFGFGCLVATLATCFIYGTDVNSLNEGFVAKAMAAAAGSADGTTVTAEALAAGREVVGRLLPVAFGLLGLQVAHDLGHAAAAKSHNTKISLPYFLPSLQVGIFGSITNFLEFPKSRKALFDIAIAGPFAGFLCSLAATLYGLTLTASASPELLSTFPALPTGFFSSSFLLHELVDNFLHISAVAPTALTAVHPLVAVGMTGLLANALNFLPIGRLDGGRVAMAIGGRQSADQIAFITLISQAVSIFSDASPIYFFWIVLVVFLQRGADIPPEDDVTPVATVEEDQKKGPKWIARALALGFCLSLTGAMILPVPQQSPPVTASAPAQAPVFAPARAPVPSPQESTILRGLEDMQRKQSTDV
jgi:Zn-dependent protease